jgi:hypothetical protein
MDYKISGKIIKELREHYRIEAINEIKEFEMKKM